MPTTKNRTTTGLSGDTDKALSCLAQPDEVWDTLARKRDTKAAKLIVAKGISPVKRVVLQKSERDSARAFYEAIKVLDKTFSK